MSALGNLDSSFSDKVTIVTGGGGGMGRAIALAFSAAGSKIVVADFSDANGAETVAQVKAAGGEAVFVKTDVSKSEDVANMVATAVSTFGGLNFAINAAAIEFETDFLADLADEDFDRMIAVNLRSIFLSMKHEINAMLPVGGAIVNIIADIWNGWPEFAHSGAARGGMRRSSGGGQRGDSRGDSRGGYGGHGGSRNRGGGWPARCRASQDRRRRIRCGWRVRRTPE